MREILEIPGANKIQWLVETHDSWVASSEIKQIIQPLLNENCNVGILWDIAHTLFMGEAPEITCSELHGIIGNTHIKDAIHVGDNRQYVLPGTGELPLAKAVTVLLSKGYNGYFTFEHEKRWIPELPNPEDAFPSFISWLKKVIP